MELSNENVIHVKKDGIEYLQFKKLLEYDDIIKHAYSLGLEISYRTTSSLEELEYEKSVNNYEKLCEQLGLNYINLVKPNQAHTKQVEIVEKKYNKKRPDFNIEKYDKTDGLITNKKDIILATTNADCILLILFDPVKKVIANVHSGWRGTLQEISIETVNRMIKEYNCNPKDIICLICPSIRKCHFEVDKDVKDLFYNKFNTLKEINEIIEESILNEKWKIDTVLINKVILKKVGLKDENIIDSGICSFCNSNLIHSYRVHKKGFGLETMIIGLK